MSAFSAETAEAAEAVAEAARLLVERARSAALRLALAESCTGGLAAAALTEVPGASEVFSCGFVTYSNESKRQLLHVPQEVLAEFGAVSAETARAMAEGALVSSRADRALAVTGIAGPGGGSASRPVGLVWFALAQPAADAQSESARGGGPSDGKGRIASAARRRQYAGPRRLVRLRAARDGLVWLAASCDTGD